MITKRLFVCLVSIPVLLAGCAPYSKVKEKRISEVAVTAEQRALSKSLKPLSRQPLAQLGRYLDAADAARVQLAANPSDNVARSDYNFAVGRIVEIIGNADLTPWDVPLSCPSGEEGVWSLSLLPPDPRPEYHPSNFDIRPADRYDFRGKLVGQSSDKEGLGAPVVVIGKDFDFTNIDPFAMGRHVYYGLTALIGFDGRKCELQLLDPLAEENVPFGDHLYPLAANFQAPLALAMAELNPKKRERTGLFKPDKVEHSARLARLQPYDQKKIPVLCIHGLGNSPSTWVPMIDFLRSDAEIRKHYQFWFFRYPSGLPFALTAGILRKQMDQMNQRYPNHKDIVVLAHSLGGNISRLLITDSGMTLWNTYYDKPPAEIPFSAETRRVLSESLIFEARHDIDRVIFASPSLRGSDDATNFLGRLGSKLIGNPIAEKSVNEETYAYARPEIRAMGRRHLPNSIDMLDPDNLFLKTVNSIPLKRGIPYHLILGDRGKGGNLDRTKPQSTDGIVPYWSSHLEGAQSQVVIPSHHWTILHPLGMAETKRILLRHIEQR